ncbi:MAG: folylpolyglutamate synthase/dihydrofolate synthase family protein [Syntrophales bacterium]
MSLNTDTLIRTSSLSPLQYLESLDMKRVRLSLDPIRRLMDRLGNPQEKYRTILVAGTNGKGSISSMLYSILRKSGMKTGLYTSPHLIDFRERIRVDGAMISNEDLGSLIEEVREEIDEDITYFEFATAVAFLHFLRAGVDIAVLEVGMGGRLDATNIVHSEVSIVSNISVDHREYLGETLDQIAREKCGVIKEGGVCVTAEKKKGIIRIIEETCRERHSKLIRVGKDLKARAGRNGRFSFRGIDRRYENLFLPLRGRHQIENAAAALGAVEALSAKGCPVADQHVLDGLRDTKWEGRLEILQEKPTLVLDAAHNLSGVSALGRALAEDFSYKKLIFVFGVLRDKDYRSMLKKIAPLADHLILTGIRTQRALSLEELADVGRKYHRNIRVACNSGKALNEALALAGPDDLVCIAGSLYLVGEIKREFANRK